MTTHTGSQIACMLLVIELKSRISLAPQVVLWKGEHVGETMIKGTKPSSLAVGINPVIALEIMEQPKGCQILLAAPKGVQHWEYKIRAVMLLILLPTSSHSCRSRKMHGFSFTSSA